MPLQDAFPVIPIWMSCDVYPYTAGSTQLLHILPPEFLAGGMEAIVRRLQNDRSQCDLACLRQQKN